MNQRKRTRERMHYDHFACIIVCIIKSLFTAWNLFQLVAIAIVRIRIKSPAVDSIVNALHIAFFLGVFDDLIGILDAFVYSSTFIPTIPVRDEAAVVALPHRLTGIFNCIRSITSITAIIE